MFKMSQQFAAASEAMMDRVQRISRPFAQDAVAL
jgi:hypothetical protein